MNPWIKEEITRKNRKYFELKENENHNMSKFVTCSHAEREMCIFESLFKYIFDTHSACISPFRTGPSFVLFCVQRFFTVPVTTF